jgi:putative antitoxin of VapBC-like toxin-antitoxin system
MRTSMHIPETLLKEAMKVSGAPTQTQAVVMGLEELIRKKRLEALLKLKGTDALKLNQEDLEKMRGR